MAEEEIERRDIEALLAARRELGRDYDRELVESFADRVESAVAARAKGDATLQRQTASAGEGGRIRQFVLGIVSVGVGVPITIVPTVAADGGLPATVMGWLGIIGVNVAHAIAINRRS